MSTPTKAREKVRRIRGQLLANKGMTFTDFARRHGFDPRVVSNTVNRWAQHGFPPRGQVSRKIISTLLEELSQETEIARA